MIPQLNQLFDTFSVRHHRPGATVVEPIGKRVRPEQCEQRQRDRTDPVGGEVRDQRLRTLRQQNSNAVAAIDAVRQQRVGQPP